MPTRKPQRSQTPSRKKRSYVDEFIALPDEEKDRIAGQFNREFSIDETQPLTAKERREWAQIVRKERAAQGRKQRAKVHISLDIDGDLVHRMDAYAQEHGLSRSELLVKGAEAILAKAG